MRKRIEEMTCRELDFAEGKIRTDDERVLSRIYASKFERNC
ncbi:MAG: hypothetical protein Q7R70_05855 [Candidatus Diapherotrites archaeon]|nr:hypothetical protein [Candidatus Diapherotrites archaeon]